MKIVHIFADNLFSFQYEKEVDNEFDRLMELWTDTSYLVDYAKANKIDNIRDFVRNISRDAEQIQDFLEELNQNKKPYSFYFEALQLSEHNRILSLQKGKVRRNQLRFYAIKIDENCFVITGGAIKMSQTMQDHPDTNKELAKLRWAKEFLNTHGVSDEDSFFELLIELQ